MPRVSKTRVEGSEIAVPEIRTAVEREEAKDPLVRARDIGDIAYRTHG
jgi:hypothetical protein